MMFYDEHGVPHFHAFGPEFSAKFAIADASLISAKGKLNHRDLRAIREWGQKHRVELYSDWELACNDEPLNQIED